MIATWMLYTVLIGACAAVAAAALEPICAVRGFPRRMPWVAALVAGIAIPVLVAVRPVAIPTPGIGGAEYLIGTAGSSVAASHAVVWTWDRLLLAAWGLGSLALAAAIARGMWQLHRAADRAATASLDGAVVALTEDAGPGVRFFGTPRILVPSWLAALEPGRRALLVRHEQEHVRAGDPFLLIASLSALGAMPWNVALWFIARRLRAALELDCDARVLAAGGDVHAYGHLLLAVAASRRPPRLPAYLPLAASSSPLERRIRAMIDPPPALGVTRQFALGAAIAASVLTACEARRPEPLAPVASYTIADGVATPAAPVTAPQADSARGAIAAALRQPTPTFGAGGTVEDPLVMIHDAAGHLVMTGRLGARTATGTPAFDSIPVEPADIATIDVIKKASVLPPEAKGGLIRIILKPGVRLSDAPSTPTAPTTAPMVARESRAMPERALVIITSHDGRELHRKVLTLAPAGATGSPFDALPVASDDIATMDVTKPTAIGGEPGQAMITITLKAGRDLRPER